MALRCADLRGEGSPLRLSQRIAAGHPGQALVPGTAARIFTGALVPEGADAVVIQEDCRFDGESVTILQMPRPGDNIRLAGHDVAKGEAVLTAGHLLRPQDIGLLASLGIETVAVSRPPRIAIVNTGDEVVAPGQPLAPGQLYDSNSYTLAALLRGMGLEVKCHGIIADDVGGTEAVLRQAAQDADCLITTGGVSVGEEDHVKAAVARLGHLDLWKLAIKPGKPFAFGRVLERLFFGLPGNPVAVFVTFTQLVKPCLLRLQGASQTRPRPLRVQAGFSRHKPASRQEYLRVRRVADADGLDRLMAFANQGSSLMTSLSWADGLAIIPAGQVVAEGDWLGYLPFDGLL